ncbi:MAG: hypothetical protein EPO21_12260 [Chloroflexota bacterium]|nr:MAG: hypothetical protein EPO21_12260 [Chloroflexota bacterium]
MSTHRSDQFAPGTRLGKGVTEIDILQLIDEVEAAVVSGFKIPLVGKVVLDQYELLNLIDKIRMAVPDAIVESKRLVQERENILGQAKQIMASAEREYSSRVETNEVVQEAERRAQEIVREAERRAAEIIRGAGRPGRHPLAEDDELMEIRKREADEYSMDVLRRLESQLNGYLSSVRKGIDLLQKDTSEV